MNMKKRIALGMALLLTLGTAVAGTLMYGQQTVEPTTIGGDVMADTAPTPAMIASWKATASSADYVSTKLPI